MAWMTSSIFLDILLAILPIVYLIYWYLTHDADYWEKRGIPNSKNKAEILNTALRLKSQHELCLEMYNKFPDAKVAGFFQPFGRTLIVRDPELIQKVLIKDFVHFQDRGGPKPLPTEPLTKNLFGLQGKVWRALRYKLTPTFTTGKLRIMLGQVLKSGDNLMDKLQTIAKRGESFESKDVMYEFTLDVISSCAFGMQFKHSDAEFATFKSNVSKMFTFSVSSMLRTLAVMAAPKFAQFIGLTGFPPDASKYFLNFTKETIKFRKEKDVKRNDYLQLLLTLKEQEDNGKEMITSIPDATEDDDVIDQMKYAEVNGEPEVINMKLMTEEVICANSFIFLLAGSESTANNISFTLLKLAQHPDIQQRLQEQVDSVLDQHGTWTYDALKELTYMDQVIQETQRLYPLVPILLRECVIPYKVPETDLVIEKGINVGIPVMGLHMDPRYYPEPERFNPDRFEGNNFKPNPAFLPFGDGPRVCIVDNLNTLENLDSVVVGVVNWDYTMENGAELYFREPEDGKRGFAKPITIFSKPSPMRFAIMEVKISLARVMSQFTVKLSPKMKLPIKLKKASFFPEVEGGILLTLQDRKRASM